MRLGIGIGLTFLGGASIWNPTQAAETFFYADASRLSGAENDSVASIANLSNGRGLLASLTGTNCKLRNIRGLPAIWLDRSAPARLTGLVSASQAQPVVIYIVATSDTASSNNVLLGGGPGGALAESRITLTGTSWPRTITGGAGVALSAGTNPTQNRPFVVAFKYNGATLSRIYYNQTIKATGNGGTANFEGFTIGDARTPALPYGGLVGAVCGQLAPSDALILQTIAFFEAQYHTTDKAWRYMRVGDSTTAGTGGTANANGVGQAMAAWSNTKPGGAYLDFVGSQSNMALYSNAQHYGVGGTDSYGLNTALAAQLALYQPEIIDIRIGVNDANGTNTPYVGATSASNIAAILATCRTSLPNSRVIFGDVHALGGGGAAAANALDLNSRLPAVYATEIGLGGKLHTWSSSAAINGGVYSPTYMNDTLHPNVAGYAALASAVQTPALAAIAALG